MPRKKKGTAEERIELIQRIIDGRISQKTASQIAMVDESTIREWVRRYKAEGIHFPAIWVLIRT